MLFMGRGGGTSLIRSNVPVASHIRRFRLPDVDELSVNNGQERINSQKAELERASSASSRTFRWKTSKLIFSPRAIIHRENKLRVNKTCGLIKYVPGCKQLPE